MMSEIQQGLKLKDLLATASITQRELARRMDVSYSLVGFYIAGKKTPGFDKAVAMARELGVSLKTLASSIGLDTTGIPDDRPPE
jgi:transcriptional regulator with XRE-family HTH domain